MTHERRPVLPLWTLERTYLYRVVYADPPWKYNDRHNSKTRFAGGAYLRYPLMTTQQIADLPVRMIANPGSSMLFLWATFPKLPDALCVMRAWGFTYKTLGFSWVKTNTRSGTPFFGVGYYAKSNCEVCLLGVRGKPFKATDSVSSCVISDREEHSKKPDEVRRRIVHLCGDVPRIELFARKQHPGWDAWGDEVATTQP